MKKIRAIFTLTVLILTVAAVSATGALAAEGKLTLNDSYPEDGSTGASIENLGVKLYFDGDMSEEKAGKANGADIFQLYDSEGKALPTRVLYNSNEQGVVLVLLDTNAEDTPTVASNSEYTLKISGELVDDNGNQLGQDQEITFRTLNQTTNTIISVVMMVGMFAIMMIATSRAAKKRVEEEKKQDKVNPYKEAKKTGKSVEEIVEKDQKKKAREAEKAARKAAEEEEDSENFRVKRRHSASEAGSKYVAERRAAAEEARAKAEALEAKRKAAARKKKKK